MAVPVGVGSAIYLVEYAPRGNRFVQMVRITAETLQGIPSIIYGLFGMLFFVTALKWGLSLMAGACTLAIMVLPVIMRTTEEALLAVPDAYREGGFRARRRAAARRVPLRRAPRPLPRAFSAASSLRWVACCGRGGRAYLHGGFHRPDPPTSLAVWLRADWRDWAPRSSIPRARSPCTCTCWPAKACT